MTRTTFMRDWVVPLAFVSVAVFLTALWAWWVLRAAYDREVLNDAEMLARRVEWQLSQSAGWMDSQSTSEQLQDNLQSEMLSDSKVQGVVFCDLRRTPKAYFLWIWRNNGVPLPQIGNEQVRDMIQGGFKRSSSPTQYTMTIPWLRGERVMGFSYIVLSREETGKNFWVRQGPLLSRVFGYSASAVILLSALGIATFQFWQRAGFLQERAELSRQGLLAERGLTAAVLAHEIRNPLAALRFQLHSLRKNAADPARTDATADLIDGELSRIQELVTDYLEHERAQTMRPAPVDLVQSVGGLDKLMGDLLRSTGTKLVIQSAREPVIVICDPHALRQVLMNLVLNAQQAIGKAGLITIRVGSAEGFGTIDITDTGPGISPEMRERLFKPFQTSSEHGHGIGLALVRRFVDNFGGSVSADSEPEKGATFHLRLPLENQENLGLTGL